MKKFNPAEHVMVPKHQKLSDKEKQDVLDQFHCTMQDLPRILKNDPAIKELGAKPGDVIKITRNSPTAGEALFYRCVVNA